MKASRFFSWCVLSSCFAACEITGLQPISVTEPLFERQQLTATFHAEGGAFADLDRDGFHDIVAGTCWWRGPEYTEKRELLPEKGYDPYGYSEHFFAWPWDVDADGWVDLVTVGFPGQASHWLRNPQNAEGHWERFVIHERVENESPAFTDLTGDGVPELVCQDGAYFGFAQLDPAQPRAPWKFHRISAAMERLGPFTHGLGVGDIDGDGRADVCWREGWLRQPASLAGDPAWEYSAFSFSSEEGGAQMLITDVDGDGANDIVTSLAAHHFGLSWFRQVRENGKISFLEQKVMTDKPEDSAAMVSFCELHALALSDVNRDGLADVVTGKRWWSHGPDGECQPGAKSVTYWYELVRDGNGARYVPHLADDESGVGTTVTVGDIDKDQDQDILVVNKRGVFVLWQRTAAELAGKSAPRRIVTLDFERGDLYGWTATGEAFTGQPVRGDTATARQREASRHQGQYWIGGYEKRGDGATGRLVSDPIPVTGPWVSFLVGGGGSEQTRVELRSFPEDELLHKTSAADYESLQRVTFDVSARLGRELCVVLVDEHTGHWGHVNFDDLRFHHEKPARERSEDTPPILAADQVPHAGLEPEAARAAMSVPPGFEVDLIAAEPRLHQPVALTVDAAGRVWVAEAHTYPVRAPLGQGKDRIVVFEDRDGNGDYENRSVFMDGLNLVSGLEVGFGGVWIGAAPELLFIPDTNGDLEPDGPPIVKLDGWGFQDTHETLNSFRWGPDGWLYGCHGVFTHSRVGKPGTAENERVPLNAGVWRFHPVRGEFEVFAHGTSNPWGLDYDAQGEFFLTTCVIPHAFHVVQGGRYVRQAGAHFETHVYRELDTIADHRHWTGANPWAGNNRSGDYGGGHAHAGALVYQAEAFPEEYRGALLMNNIHGNRINRDLLTPRGSSFVASHAADLLLANDQWFRGIALAQGPMGEVFVIDWYDAQACHLNDPTRFDRGNGRLYRLRYGAWSKPRVRLSALASRELAERIADPNAWAARHARRLLQERGIGAQVAAVLETRIDGSGPGRLEALWTLHAAKGIEEGRLRKLLGDPDDAVVSWAVRLACEDRAVEAQTLAAWEELARTSASPRVRLALASAAQRIDVARRVALVEALSQRAEDEHDPYLSAMLWMAAEPLLALDAPASLRMLSRSRLSDLRRFALRRAAADPALHEALFAFLDGEADPSDWPWMLSEVRTGLAEQRGLKAPARLQSLMEKLALDLARQEDRAALLLAFGDTSELPRLRERVQDRGLSADARLEALRRLVDARDPKLEPLLPALLDEPALAVAALRAFGMFESAVMLLERYASLPEEQRVESMRSLAERPELGARILDAIEDGRLPRSALDALAATNLHAAGDQALRERLERVWGRVRSPGEQAAQRVKEWKARLSAEALARADLPRGREVYSRTCQNCHALFGRGAGLGPELTGSNRADLDYLLTNLIDPSAVIGQDYLATLVWTEDGRFFQGLLRSETDNSLTLENERERITLDKREIEKRERAPHSLMPEGQLEALSFEEARDLIAYLRSPGQTPIRGTRANAASFFDGRTLQGWRGDGVSWRVEAGELIGSTTGLARNEFLIGELELGDFRLELDVQLVRDEGNSGIQFRSVELPEREVMGYQADIGPGWWGKLYEEHRRGLLHSSFDAAHFVPGAWHHYAIEARGSKVRTWIDGQLCVDLEDPEGLRRGVVAFQLHSGPATELRVRNPRLEIFD
jgi:putative membrane-bound dehydrogenase-like protein